MARTKIGEKDMRNVTIRKRKVDKPEILRSMDHAIAKKRIHPRQTVSSRAELLLPVPRVKRRLQDGRYAFSYRRDAVVALTAALEYLMAELMEISSAKARAGKKGRITPRHIMLALEEDDDMKSLFKGTTIASSGVRPKILTVPKEKRRLKNQ